MANWPTTVPLPIVDGAEFQPQPNTIRTPMEVSVAKVRRRYTAVGDDFSGVLICTSAEFDALWAFVTVTLKDVLPFTWSTTYRPDGMPAARSCRFKTRPARKALGSDGWEVRIELEVLP